MEIFERLKQVIDACSGGNQSTFVKRIDESISTFNGYMSLAGQERIKVKTLRQILVIFNINANWLLLGSGGMFRDGQQPVARPCDPIAQRVDQVAQAMRDAGVDEMKILAAARDMIEGEMTKLTKERGGYGVAEPHPGLQRAAEEPADYTDPKKAAGTDTV